MSRHICIIGEIAKVPIFSNQRIRDGTGLNMRRYVTVLGTMIVLLAGCAKPVETKASDSKSTVSVNVHGVNYTADPFTYSITDPKSTSNQAGGEHVGPYSGGGIMCCFTLPVEWEPGMKVKVHITYWLKEDPGGHFPEVKRFYTVEVPRYPSGKAGELWVLRTAEGGVEVVMSDVEPGNAGWPGKVKGWPQPPLIFERERWELDRKQAEMYVSIYQDGLQELNSNKKIDLSEEWDLDRKYHESDVKKFSGPNDAKYVEYKRQIYTEGLKRSKARLDQLMKSKP